MREALYNPTMPIVLYGLAAEVLGWLALPVAFQLFRALPGRGAALARPLGLLTASWVLWMGASSGVLVNDSSGVLAAVLAVAGLSAWLLWRQPPLRGELRDFLRREWRLLLGIAVLFWACLLAWSALRAYAGLKIYFQGGEKFMEIAFLNGILNSAHFPPQDPWLSGFGISYYYFGYVMMALMVRWTGVAPSVGFDLHDALTFAMAALAAFELAYGLVRSSGGRRAAAAAAGGLGALFLVGMGNLAGLVESLYARGWLPRAAAEWLAIPDLTQTAQVTGSFLPSGGWAWWWRASRVLNDLDLNGNPLGVQPISEFPFFSFLLGDNHPHKLGLPFAVMATALAYQFFLDARAGRRAGWLRLLLTGWGIGALVFLNTWDFPIYWALALGAYALGRWQRGDPLRDLVDRDGRRIALGITAGIGFYLPFFNGFSSQAGGVLPYVFPPTRLAQYLLIFAPFVWILAGFMALRLRRQLGSAWWKTAAQAWARWALAATALFGLVLLLTVGALVFDQMFRGGQVSAAAQSMLGGAGVGDALVKILGWRLRLPGLFLLLSLLLGLAWSGLRRDQDVAGGFVCLLALAGFGLTWTTEFAYLRDVFGVRMNTVFKFYFQAWALLAPAAAYALWALLRRCRRPGVVLAAVGGLLAAAGMVYPVLAVWSRADGFAGQPGLDAAAPLRAAYPDDFAAIDWINLHAAPDAVILEAPGTSYTFAGRIGAFTGRRSVLGWVVHEQQWRGNYVEQARREAAIAEMFTSDDPQRLSQLLADYGVDFIVTGATENETIRTACRQAGLTCSPEDARRRFASLFPRVFQQGNVEIFRVVR